MQGNVQRAVQIVKEMLSDRGYDIPERIDDFVEEDFICYRASSVYIVYVITTSKIGISVFRTCIQLLDDVTSHIIFVSAGGATPETRNQAKRNESCIEFFTYDTLSFNPAKHFCVPSHTLATEKDIELLQKHLCIRSLATLKQKLPVLLSDDVIARYYKFPLNSIVKIVRHVDVLSPQVVYRIVKTTI